MKQFLILILLVVSSSTYADGLKVFGPEYCSGYDAGSCINFHHKDLKEAKNFWGNYKYPEGKKAYDNCVKNISGTDGEYAYCSMKFHYAEQSEKVRRQMCHITVREKYLRLASRYAFDLYDRVWMCK